MTRHAPVSARPRKPVDLRAVVARILRQRDDSLVVASLGFTMLLGSFALLRLRSRRFRRELDTAQVPVQAPEAASAR